MTISCKDQELVVVLANTVSVVKKSKSKRKGTGMMSELDILIGRRLQTARKAQGFKSARSFAKHHQIPESTYSQHETGKRSLNPTTLTDYCNKLNICPGWLITGKKNEPMPVNTKLLAQVLYQKLFKLITPNAQSQFATIVKLCTESYKQAAASQTEKAS